MVRALIAGGTCCAGCLGYSSEDTADALEHCKSVEDRAYPAVRDIGTETLVGLTYTLERNLYCEETGEP
jgi:hypothetical protein